MSRLQHWRRVLRSLRCSAILVYKFRATSMASINLQPVPPFVVDAELGLSLASRWALWLREFNTFLLASGITDKKRQRALLLYQAGPQVREIFAQLTDVGGDSDFDLAKEKLTHSTSSRKRIGDMRCTVFENLNKEKRNL